MRLNTSNNKFFLLIAILSVIAPLVAGNKSQSSVALSDMRNVEVSDADRRKAEYVFLEAERQRSLDNYPAYYELLRHAHKIDPTNTVTSFYIGYMTMAMNNTTEEQRDKALALMRQHYLEHPEDYIESYTYGRMAAALSKHDQALEVWKKLSELFPDKTDVKFSLAEAYGATGDFKNALETYDSIEATQGKVATITTRKINVYMAMRDSLNAIAECKSLLATASENVQYNLLMSRLYATYDMRDSALAYIDNAQRFDPDNGGIFLARAQFYNSIGDTVNYDKQIYNALISKNLDVESKLGVLFDYSRDLVQSKDSSERADTLFRVLIEEHPHEKQIHELYSHYLWAKEDYKAAGEQLSYALDADPTSSSNWRMLMGCYLMTENYGEAVKAGENAIKYNPKDVELYRYIAPAYAQLKEYDKSIDLYNKVLEMVDSTDYETQSDMVGGIADVLLMKCDTVAAIEKYEQSLEINPGNVPIMNNYAYVLVERNQDLDKAEKLSFHTVTDDPENTSYLDTYAWIMFKKKEYKTALEYIEKALKIEGEKATSVLLEHYGDILFMNGEPEAALAQWEQALKLQPDNEMLKKKVKYKTYFFK